MKFLTRIASLFHVFRYSFNARWNDSAWQTAVFSEVHSLWECWHISFAIVKQDMTLKEPRHFHHIIVLLPDSTTWAKFLTILFSLNSSASKHAHFRFGKHVSKGQYLQLDWFALLKTFSRSPSVTQSDHCSVLGFKRSASLCHSAHMAVRHGKGMFLQWKILFICQGLHVNRNVNFTFDPLLLKY